MGRTADDSPRFFEHQFQFREMETVRNDVCKRRIPLDFFSAG
jgi:hypothetical protein